MDMIGDSPERVTFFWVCTCHHFHNTHPKEWIFLAQLVRGYVGGNVDKGEILQVPSAELVEVLLSHGGRDVDQSQDIPIIRGQKLCMVLSFLGI